MAVYFGYIYIILFYIFTAKHKKSTSENKARFCLFSQDVSY